MLVFCKLKSLYIALLQFARVLKTFLVCFLALAHFEGDVVKIKIDNFPSDWRLLCLDNYKRKLKIFRKK